MRIRETALALAVVLLLCVDGYGCAGRAAVGCERSAYELEGHYRCTGAAELQTLECGEWVTVEQCAAAERCSPGPEPSCGEQVAAGWCCDAICGLTAAEADTFEECTCAGMVEPDALGRGECVQ